MDSASTPATRPFFLAWCIFLLIMEFCGAGFAGSGFYTRFDFRLFYGAGYLVRTHPSQLFDFTQQEVVQHALISKAVFLPFYHPAYEAILFAPFSFLSYRTAYLAFIAFNLLLLMAALSLLHPELSSLAFTGGKSRPWLLFFLFVPLLICVVHGQDSILLLLIGCVTWRQLESGKDLSAGCVLALALFKFQIVIPVATLIAVRHGWRFAAGFLLASVGVLLLCIAMIGPADMMSYIRLLLGAVSSVDESGIAHARVTAVMPSAKTNLVGLLYGCGARFLRAPWVINVLIGICSLVLFAWCARMVRRREEKVAFSIAVLCGLLVSFHLFIYDLTLSLLPVALLGGRVHRYILLAIFGLPIVFVPFGAKWLFPTAAPVLAMLIYVIVSTPNQVPSVPAHAAPV
jgi:hypothetical protein